MRETTTMPALASSDRRGAALIMALVVSIAVAAMALGAIFISSSARLTTRFSAREASMQASANAGLEIIRDSVNNGSFDSLLPLAGFTTIATTAAVYDASGDQLPRMTRSLYVGRTGGRTGGAATAGQYGSNFASALSVIRDERGAVAARRLLMTQESWSKFAVAINEWNASSAYGCSESINGPFHSNQRLRLQSGCGGSILFSGPASVVGVISNQNSANFAAGLKTNAALIEWPTPAKVALMKQFAADADAANGDYDLTSPMSTTNRDQRNQPRLRIEFLTVDVNGNGTIEWDEGYMRVFRAKSSHDSLRSYISGRRWPVVPSGTTYNNDPNMVSRNCGGQVSIGGTARWLTARRIYDIVLAHSGNNAGDARNAVRWVLSRGHTGNREDPLQNVAPTNVRCFLGGDPMLYEATAGTSLTPDSIRTDTTGHAMGWWIKRRSGAHASVSGIRADAEYLIPLGKNPNYKGVIFVTGDVAISGTLRGRTSVFATGSIILADDLLYHTPPGTKCDAEGDIFGAIATEDIVISDNNVQTPFRIDSRLYGGYDDTPKDEQYNLFFMSVNGNFYTSGLSYLSTPGPTPPYYLSGTTHATASAESCASGPSGCIRITGGLAMGNVDHYTYNTGSNPYGFAEAHTYDRCGAVNPPPYFPTTGRFSENRYYEVDPVWLNEKGIANYFTELRAQ
jgi:hypothetical protein